MEPEHLSRAATLAHRERVRFYMAQITGDLTHRADVHDESKLHGPEVEHFDAAPPLDQIEFPSPEYDASLAMIEPALRHHWGCNDHHPQHWDALSGMHLPAWLEWMADCKASTERMRNGNFRRSLEHQFVRFAIPPFFASILLATAEYLNWLED